MGCQTACSFLRTRPSVPLGVYSLEESLVWSGPAPPSSSPRDPPVSFPALFSPYPREPASPHPFLLTHCCVCALGMGLTGESVQGIRLG